MWTEPLINRNVLVRTSSLFFKLIFSPISFSGFVSYDNPQCAHQGTLDSLILNHSFILFFSHLAIQSMNGFQIGMKRLKVQLKRPKDLAKPY